MNDQPPNDTQDDEQREPDVVAGLGESESISAAGAALSPGAVESLDAAPAAGEFSGASPHAVEPAEDAPIPVEGNSIAEAEILTGAAQQGAEPQMFQSFYAPPPPPRPVRIPHFGHLLVAVALAVVGLFVSIVLMIGAVHIHLFGVRTLLQAGTDIHYILGSEAAIYIIAFCLALLVFPAIWGQGLFAGLQWNGATALRLSGRLVGAAFVCFLLAWLNTYLIPSPENAPIEKIFRTPGAAWFLFAFGVTMAPFFEEMFFRGFLLPSLCTAYDWIAEKITAAPPPPLPLDGGPHWSLTAMIVGSIATSIPFAAMHAAQTGYAIGPFLLLVGVSLVLCGVRLVTRSLASSVLVHACYNFLLFSLMLVGTSGFRHLDKM
jgi:uncharacterized protein